jgi:4-amino-4-deoxy-L-arabinose transferase-like glycosyltransferase
MISAQRSSSGILWGFAVLICTASLAFMLYAALHESAIVDEAAHIPAGYAYVRELDFRLNPEHPPLVKALAALPLLILRPEFPTDGPAWTNDVNGQWEMGRQFLYGSGNDADTIVAVSRIMPILLTLLTVLFIYFWSKKLMGGAWALLPTFLFALSPTVLAHGHYVTTDIGAAFGVLFATYFFLEALREPSPKNIIFAGLALGVAELMKFSAVLLFPYFVILAIIHFFANARGLRGKYFWQSWLRRFGQLLLVFAIAFVVIWAVYALFTVNYPQERQMFDTRFNLTDFAETLPTANLQCVGLKHCLANAEFWLAGNQVTRPLAEYFLGVIMVIHRSAGGNTAYFLGEVSASGSHWYFPIVYLLKESLPVLIVVLGAFLATLWSMSRRILRGQAWSGFRAYLQDHFSEFALIFFLVIYWAYSVSSTLNIGVRHLMPVIPIMYMLAAGVWRKWITGLNVDSRLPALDALWVAMKSLAASWLKLSVLCALLLWVILETFAVAPHFLSYFNQFGGGTRYGYRYTTDSNYDWGQDMLLLRKFVEEHPEIDKIAVHYFGTTGAPAYYLGPKETDWWSARGNPANEGIHWLAMSIYTLQNAVQPTAPEFYRAPEENYSWLTALRPAPDGVGQVPEPDYRVGTTIFVYKL